MSLLTGGLCPGVQSTRGRCSRADLVDLRGLGPLGGQPVGESGDGGVGQGELRVQHLKVKVTCQQSIEERRLSSRTSHQGVIPDWDDPRLSTTVDTLSAFHLLNVRLLGHAPLCSLSHDNPNHPWE